MELGIDAEMKMFEGMNTPVIFLQNVIVDLLYGLGMDQVFVHYAEYIKKKYNAEPGFITMNMPRMVDMCERLGIENPIICSSINKMGFRMVIDDKRSVSIFRRVGEDIFVYIIADTRTEYTKVFTEMIIASPDIVTEPSPDPKQKQDQ